MSNSDRTESPQLSSIETSPVQKNTGFVQKTASPTSYTDQLKQDFEQIFNTLDLSSLQRTFLRSRWLDQLLWMEGKAAYCRDRYYRLRLTTIVLGVIVPILISLNVNDQKVSHWIRSTTLVLSGIVAVSSAVEEFFHYGERWYAYRRSAESLKAEGWQFFQLGGSYHRYKTHADAFIVFVSHIEEIIQQDVETYVTRNTQPSTQAEESQNAPSTARQPYDQSNNQSAPT